MENLFDFLDIKFVTIEIVKTLIALSVPLVLGALYWLCKLRGKSNSINLLLENRQLTLYYGGKNSDKCKTITFPNGGNIGEGKNDNESYWKVSFGTLKILSSDKKRFSEFRWDGEMGKLVHINDPSLPSVMGQFIIPFVKNKE